jgi:hypothetical protein
MRIITSLSIVILFFDIHDAYSQYPVPFYFMSGNRARKSIDYQIHSGFLKLRDGQVVTGRFKYDKWEFPVRNFAFYKDADESNKRKIKFKDIQQVSFVGVDTNIAEKPDSTIFVNINGKLLRKLTEGKINLYDKLIVVREAEGVVGATIFVKEDEKLKRVDTLRKLNKWYQNLSKQYPDLQVQNKYLNKIEIIKEIQKYNALRE